MRATAAAALVAAGALLLVLQARTWMMLLAGVLLALALRGCSRFLSEKARVPYPLALVAVTLVCVAGVGTSLLFLGAGIARQAEAFAQQLPVAWNALLDRMRSTPGLSHAVGELQKGLPAASTASSSLLSGTTDLIQIVAGLVVVFFLGVYGAARPEAYSSVVVALVPPAHRERASAILAEIGRDLTRWLASRAIAMAVVGVLVTVGLLILKIPLAVTLGVLAGLLTFVEYLGAIISAAPAMLLALTRGGAFVLWVALVFGVAHLVEGYLLTPMLVRASVRIPPGYTLAAQILLGATFGVLGLTFATPIVLVTSILVRRLYVDPREARMSA